MKKSKVGKLVESLRASLEEGEAFGPEGTPVSKVAREAEAGTLGAENPSDIADAVLSYLGDIVDSLMENFEVDEEEAFDFLFEIAAAMAEDGALPEMPEEDDDEGMAEWLGAAKTAGFAQEVLAAAAEMAEG